jgi:DNA-directed RNA polymerase specialized sigma24 family protein
VSLTPAQQAQILYLYQVEAMSIRFIAVHLGLSYHAVERVVYQSRPPTQEKAEAMRPSSKDRVERQLHRLHVDRLRRTS